MIDLYTCRTANGYRASIMLEETGLPYTVHPVDLLAGEHRSPSFVALHPLGRLPAIVDHGMADGKTLALSETLAIALHLAERSARLIPTDPAERARAWQWAATVVSGFGSAIPGIFFARQIDADAHRALIEKFYRDIANYLGVMNAQLEATTYLGGEAYSFADVLAIPTVLSSLPRFEVDVAPYPAIVRWRDEVAARPAVVKGMAVP